MPKKLVPTDIYMIRVSMVMSALCAPKAVTVPK